MVHFKKEYNTQSGNVLFLILIAVALFAALSYAVTQSTRSSGGSTAREQSILNSAAMVQYPSSLRTNLIRMILSGTDVGDLEFNPPADFGNLSDNAFGVFHPEGGGAVYQLAPGDVMQGSAQGTWTFNAEFFIPQIGLDAAGGNDIIAFLPNVNDGVCESINNELSIDTASCVLQGNIPTLLSGSATANVIDTQMDHTYPTTFPTPLAIQGNDDGGTCQAFSGQASGCFYDGTNTRNVFFSVLLER